MLECCELMFWRKSWREFVVKWNMLNGGWKILLIFAKQCKRNSTESSSLLLTEFLSSFLIDHPDVQNFVKSNQRSFYYGLHPLFDIFSLSFDEQTNIQDPSINSIKIYRTLFFCWRTSLKQNKNDVMVTSPNALLVSQLPFLVLVSL